MCGISGFTFDDKTLLDKMMRAQTHRGPDQQGRYTDKAVSLGHNRLSILDLSPKGRQPMESKDGSLVIVFNGEIYNYQEIKSELIASGFKFISTSDTEVIIYAYQKWGVECLKRFNGAFAFAIYDKKKKELFCARDRIGKKPFYYYIDPKDNSFYFASEIKSLLEVGMPRRLDDKALSAFLQLRYNPYHQTLFSEIKKLPPAHYAIVKIGKKSSMDLHRYWSLDDIKPFEGSQAEAIKKLQSLMQDSVRLRMISDVPIGVYLSGGLDSSSIAALMRQKMGKGGKLQTYSVGFNEESDELGFAKKVAGKLNADHTELMIGSDSIKHIPQIVWHTDEPIADPALIPVYLLSKKSKKTSTVILTGDGADEFFAGYEQYKYLTKASKLNNILPAKLMGLGAKTGLNLTPIFMLKKVFKYAESIGEVGRNRAAMMLRDIKNPEQAYLDFVSIMTSEELASIAPGISHKDLAAYLRTYFQNNSTILTKLLRMESENLLVENFCMKNDKMTMASGIEGRMPFIDHRVAEFAFSLRDQWKLNGTTEKWIVREAMKALIPKEIFERKKQRFYVPIDTWMTSDDSIKSFITSNLKESHLDTKEIGKIFENYTSAPLYYGRQAWSIFTYLMWKKIYIDDVAPKSIKF